MAGIGHGIWWRLGRNDRGLRLRLKGSFWGARPVFHGGSLAICLASMVKPTW